jgi:Ca2+-binding EF-hand superfamily protein
MQQLFALMDKNKDGVVDETELAIYFKSLGFTWLQEKQIAGIIKRAGSEDGILRMEQFKGEFPKTLRTNLIKLAKKNGGELGFLS